MIVAVDYDGTLETHGKLNQPLIDALRDVQRSGNTVILWTCREGQSLQSALNALMRVGFRPQYVNCNTPEAVRRMGRDSRKIYADVYIDDKGVPAWTSAKHPGTDI